jgi:integrase
MCLLLDHGLRCGEVGGLKVSDFKGSIGEMTFYRPKGTRRKPTG